MTIALIITDRDLTKLSQRLSAVLPEVKIVNWQDKAALVDAEFAVCWRQPSDIWQYMPKLKVICSLGAGVDGIMQDKQRPTHLPVIRIVDSSLAEQMADYVLAQILAHKCRVNTYNQQQQAVNWQFQRRLKTRKVAVLGVGQIGHYVAQRLQANNFEVKGWSRTPKPDFNFIVESGKSGLYQLAGWADYIVSILPATPETDNIFNESFFNAMSPNGVLINVGRGNTLDELALVGALEHKKIAGAILDVFKQEPLPASHPFWSLENIVITPHISAITSQAQVFEQIAQNYKAMKAGQSLANLVDQVVGY